MSNPMDYTIGWICALTTEYVAAQEFLDEEHEPPETIEASDSNDYTCGKMGKHNVVIAVLPDGEYGTASAASVTTNMLNSFPNVRIGLMVGIGGGAPSTSHDIRLGDIVVSTPVNGDGGVLQYDFGKTIQNQAFKYTAFLNQPPMTLRTALAGLKSYYERKGHQLDQAVDRVLENNPRLRQKYQRPPQDTDRLFKADIVHDSGGCMKVCAAIPSNLIPRQQRSSYENSLVIHYGKIASGNQLMKDACIRDKLAAEEDVLCFEMEAAGLVNQLPCLIVRGICDYSDSHKSKEWQGYAAMAAAAFSKYLLSRIPPNRIENEKKMSQILTNALDSVTTIKSHVANVENDNLLNWITDTTYGSKFSDALSRRAPGTGQWLLDCPEYQTWLSGNKATLFCPGIPGAGKTILTSIVIENLLHSLGEEAHKTGIAYIYFDYKMEDQQTLANLIASLLRQLVSGSSGVPRLLKELYQDHHKASTRPTIDEYLDVIRLVASGYSRVFIVLDALDECLDFNGCRRRFLSEIFLLSKKCNMNIFATSRPIPDISRQFIGCPSLEIRAHKDDLQIYLDDNLWRLPNFVKHNVILWEEIKKEMLEAVDGMFLLARLHLDTLAGKTSIKAIRTFLRQISHGSNSYNDAYENILKRIKGQIEDHRNLAERVLSWIIYARVQLNTIELQEALAVELGQRSIDEENLPDIELMISVCCGLVTVDEQSQVFQLIHYTAIEYFDETCHLWFPEAEVDITSSIATYLSFDAFGEGPCTLQILGKKLKDYPLYRYAAKYWGYHARRLKANNSCAIKFLEKHDHVNLAIYTLLAERTWPSHTTNMSIYPNGWTGLHLCAFFGFEKGVEVFLEDLSNGDLPDRFGRTPLWWAAWNGQESVVKLLSQIETVDLDLKDQFGCTPLMCATKNGHEIVTKFLLGTGKVDANARDDLNQTPLIWAAKNGLYSIGIQLLEAGKVDIDATDDFGITPLFWAAGNGHAFVVRLLIDTGRIQIDAKDYFGHTPLVWAVREGHGAVVKLLLETGEVNPNTRDNFGQSPLLLAAANGKESVVKQLLEVRDIELDSRDEDGQTPLYWAASNGHGQIVALLLATGKVDIDSKNDYGETPLISATRSGYKSVVNLLREKRDDFAKGKKIIPRAEVG